MIMMVIIKANVSCLVLLLHRKPSKWGLLHLQRMQIELQIKAASRCGFICISVEWLVGDIGCSWYALLKESVCLPDVNKQLVCIGEHLTLCFPRAPLVDLSSCKANKHSSKGLEWDDVKETEQGLHSSEPLEHLQHMGGNSDFWKSPSVADLSNQVRPSHSALLPYAWCSSFLPTTCVCSCKLTWVQPSPAAVVCVGHWGWQAVPAPEPWSYSEPSSPHHMWAQGSRWLLAVSHLTQAACAGEVRKPGQR